ncbi:hypothetical protein DN752_21925 [Echinicola strongylocentroti]|uniref:DUF3829 domain-containing protein n=1 Tax=Echinicola strongylocentroti TaxID=1795355 RepID=A0A2Z4INC7_9BACT|nr:hypothetical protein [Echinicola strongylocentroti]AWW32592.1 hypothetical protein DN752_21925 [Echinicola strongylocentroti]
MKMKQMQRLGLTGLSFLLVLMFMTNCGTKEMESTDPYQFQEEEFEAVPDIPDVADPEPEVVEPEIGDVVTSPGTSSVIDDLGNVNGESEIDPATQGNLDDIAAFSNNLSADFKAKAENLSEEDINAIFDSGNELSSEYGELLSALENISPGLLSLLPKINYSDDYAAMNTEISFPEEGQLRVTMPDDATLRTENVYGPCTEAALKAYDKKIDKLKKQRDKAIEKAQKNYERRLDEAEDRYDSRSDMLDEKYEEKLATVKLTVLALYGVAEQVSSFNPELGAVLKYFTIIYGVYARQQVDTWYSEGKLLLKYKFTEEKLAALEARDECIQEILEEYDKCVDKANEVLKDALAACHDQGAGN